MIFGTVGGVISLASLFDSIIAWVDFIREIILAYREIVDALWGPLFDLLPFPTPRWLHDYFTICGLTGIAVLWSLHQTAKELGFEKLGSTFSAIRRMFFDFSTARSALQTFSEKAQDESKLGQPVTSEVSAFVAELARLDQPRAWIAINWLWIVALAAIIALAPYLIPFLMVARDRSDITRARKLFQMRRAELNRSDIEQDLKNSISEIFEGQASTFLTFEKINELYYSKVIKNQLWYYGVVFLAFFALIFGNYAYNQFQQSYE